MEKEAFVLSLRLKSGEYLTIGENIILQIFKQPGSAVCVEIQAPREIPILRGEVHERSGERPDGLLAERPKSLARRRYDTKRQEMWLEQKARREARYQRAEEERRDTLRELTEVADRLDELMTAYGSTGVQERLKALCGRFAAMESTARG